MGLNSVVQWTDRELEQQPVSKRGPNSQLKDLSINVLHATLFSKYAIHNRGSSLSVKSESDVCMSMVVSWLGADQLESCSVRGSGHT